MSSRFCLHRYPGPVLCGKMLGYMVRGFKGVVFSTEVTPSNDAFYVVARFYVSQDFSSRVIACVTIEWYARDCANIRLLVAYIRVFPNALATWAR